MDITVNGADVIVFFFTPDNQVIYLLNGNSADGSLKSTVYLNLNNTWRINTYHNDGPAINITVQKTYLISNWLTEHQCTYRWFELCKLNRRSERTIFSEGQLVFNGNGALSVKGNKGHAFAVMIILK